MGLNGIYLVAENYCHSSLLHKYAVSYVGSFGVRGGSKAGMQRKGEVLIGFLS